MSEGAHEDGGGPGGFTARDVAEQRRVARGFRLFGLLLLLVSFLGVVALGGAAVWLACRAVGAC